MRRGVRWFAVGALVATGVIGFASWRALPGKVTAGPLASPPAAAADVAVLAPMPPGRSSRSAPRPSQSAAERADRHVVTKLASQFDEFASRARGGDLGAAHALYEALTDCANSPVNARELEDFKRRVADPSSSFASMGTTERKQTVDEQVRLYERCGDLSSFQRKSRAEWALQLAEAGDAQMRLRYAFVGKPTDFTDPELGDKYQAFLTRAKGYLQAAIDSGETSALIAMAQAYMPGTIIGTELEQPFGIDPALAYEYYYAYALTGDVQPSIVTAEGSYGAIDSILAKLEGRLTPEQLASAREAGRSIVERCCRNVGSK